MKTSKKLKFSRTLYDFSSTGQLSTSTQLKPIIKIMRHEPHISVKKNAHLFEMNRCAMKAYKKIKK